MISRVWHGKVRKEQAEEYIQWVLKTGVAEYRKTPGNLGVQVWEKCDEEFTHIWTVTLWRDPQAIQAFAGVDIEEPKYLKDEKHLLTMEKNVAHYEVINLLGEEFHKQWRITM